MAGRLRELNPVTMFFAYDTPDDYEPLVEAGKQLRAAGFKQENHIARCYVLCGFRGDTVEAADTRMRQTWSAGFFPMAMLYRDNSGKFDLDWKRFQRTWANQHITASKLKQS